MPASSRVLVVGTTPDYIDWIRRARPGEALFLTQKEIREGAREPAPEPGEELLSALALRGKVTRALDRHLEEWGLAIAGVACFDCEWMDLAASLAERYALPFCSRETAQICRDKEATKARWREAGVGCPRAALVRSPEEAAAFGRSIGGPVVLKPTSGAGSELTFLCRTEAEIVSRYALVSSGLAERRDHPLYRDSVLGKRPITAEEFVEGDEYSADFLVEGGTVTLIRLTQKIRDPNAAFGTTMGYLTIGEPPAPITVAALTGTLARAASALGIDRGIAMVDVIVRGAEVALLEMTPRPGGDCLPWLLRHALGIDILSMNFDVALGRPVAPASFRPRGTYAGLRLRARRPGTLRRIRDEAARSDPRVREALWVRRPGDAIRLPPEDYDSSLLGHLIAGPLAGNDVEAQCAELLGLVAVEIEG